MLLLHRKIREMIDPKISYTIHEIPVPKTSPLRYVLDIHVRRNQELPVTIRYSGGQAICVRRSGKTRLADSKELRELILESDSIPYDRALTGRLYQKKDFTKLFAMAKDRDVTISEKALMSKGFMSPEKELSAGALLFADDCQDEKTKIVATLWPGMTKGRDLVLACEEYTGNLIDGIRFACNFVKSHSVQGYVKREIGRDMVSSYPMRSVLEGIVNAVAYRNYYETESPIEIHIFRDRLEILSPGSLPGIARLDKETNIAAIAPGRRNEVICAVLDMLHLMEEQGSGCDRIEQDYAPCRDLCQPYISSDQRSFLLTLPDIAFASGITGTDLPKSGVQVDGRLSGKKDRDILEYCYPTAHTVREIAEYLGILPSTYFRQNTLERLRKEHYLAAESWKPVKYRTNPEYVYLP